MGPHRARVTSPLCLIAGLAIAAVPLPLGAQEHAHGDHAAGTVGRVEFPTTCREDVAPAFETAVAMLHSFWFDAAARAFEEVAAADPSCAMAYWGTAMTLLGNPMTRIGPTGERLEAGRRAAERARELAADASHRELMYADAVVAYYEGEDRDHAARMRAHEEAMAALSRTHPEDPEATIFLGRAMVANAPPDDLTFARQIAAAELMQPLFDARPDHPGLAHYIIHAYDAPALADRGTEAALAYAEIAPSAPHALHMPSHIFTRLGYWDESIETNTRSAQAEPDPDAAVHPMDYMVYAYLQLGRDAEAKDVVDRAVENADRFYGGLIGYNFAAMPARYALERSAWTEAAALRIPGEPPPYIEAVTRFARALGSARSGDPDAAEAEARALARLQATLQEGGDAYWATVVEAQHLAARAWIALARGDRGDAVRLAREAAELEGTVEKHPVTPGPILPARELEGDLLMELGRHEEALAAYEATLSREPRRARALYGAARAAEEAGRRDVATGHYRELLDLMEGADPDRPEPEAARRFLGVSGAGS